MLGPLPLPPTLRPPPLFVPAFGFQPVAFVSVPFAFFSVGFFGALARAFAVLALGRLPLTRPWVSPSGLEPGLWRVPSAAHKPPAALCEW